MDIHSHCTVYVCVPIGRMMWVMPGQYACMYLCECVCFDTITLYVCVCACVSEILPVFYNGMHMKALLSMVNPQRWQRNPNIRLSITISHQPRS